MTAKFHETLGADRLESKFPDAKPLYTESEAYYEANRCLFCYDAPCISACPTGIDVPGFIRKIATGNIKASARTIFEANMLGTSCSRVCPVEVLCAGACVFNDLNGEPIHIGRLQRYATEKALFDEAETGRKLFEPKPDTGKKVALIGAGPASLACAAYLALEGVKPTIFERGKLPGGLNTTGVAPYKLHAESSLDEVSWLLSHGVDLKTEVEVGKDVTADQLRRDYDAVFVGIGMGDDRLLSFGNENNPYVLGATALIEAIKNDAGFQLPPGVKTAVIVGGGNTAIDIARQLAGLGVEDVSMIYRRTAAEMSGYKHEMDYARKEGVTLVENARPVKVHQEEDRVLGLRVASTVTDQETEIACDLIVMAVGQESRVHALGLDIEVNDRGHVVVDLETMRTGREGVWAGGDCINGGKEVVNAAADGREAALDMLRSWGLQPRKWRYSPSV
ncbi:MAG: NAD(P)-dependent oxidoreductase [Acidobacteriota bacterium]|nr:NAD(P)-dependent oxidoreductase [Acidobacteriota bacterium]